MIDLHTHILPQMDDGSSSVEESIKLIEELHTQGIDRIVLSSHFYAEEEYPEEYLKRRELAYKVLTEKLDESDSKNLFLGAEVCYYMGVSYYDDIDKLCIEGTPLLLLEMPKTRFDKAMLEEVKNLIYGGKVLVVLAHIDRYFDCNKLSTFRELRDMGAYMQVNAEFLANRKNRCKIKKLLNKDLIQFVGSDCHDIELRKPYMKEALNMLKNIGGDRATDMLEYYEEQFFD